MPIVLLLALACNGPDRDSRDKSVLLDVAETETWRLPGLSAPAWVVRTEGNVPHVYATDRNDVARVQGFVLARDRFAEMDLARRLSQGRLAELLGDAALSSDMESRGIGMTHVCDTLDSNLTDEQAAMFEAFAEGVNAYVAQVRAGELPPPSEYAQFAPMLGVQPADMMVDWGRRDVVAIGATLIYELGYETGDVGEQANYDQLDGFYAGAPLEDLRQAGLFADIWDAVEPVKPISSAHGFGLETGDELPPSRSRRGGKPLPRDLAERAVTRFEALEKKLGHDHENDAWGSNAWAVMGSKTADGRALLAGDGHLPLSVPSLFYTIGLDTSVLGGGDLTQIGVVFPGMPILAVGTNGRVAWGQTQLMGDITDWYREELQLDEDGAPMSTTFQGAPQPLVAYEESYTVADVPLMGSTGRTEAWTRWTTFDGRWIADIEGRSASPDEVLADGETLVNLQGDWVVPGDTDGDGVITAISFDYTGLDDGNLFLALDGFGNADDVEELREATKSLVAYSQNIAAADQHGSILYSPYQAVPCRGYLEREGDGRWTEGSDPSMLLDGTRYGGFEIVVTDGVVDEAFADDPYKCVVPHAEYPAALDPSRGYILTANNDPGGHSLDGKLYDDPWYIGGPWTEGYRAYDIDRLLAEEVADGQADVAAMQSIQAHTDSPLGQQLVPLILEAVEAGKAAAEGDPEAGTPEARLLDVWASDAQLQEAADRLAAWHARGCPTPSGVATFYNEPAGQEDDAVATMIFNVWVGRFVAGSLDDEGLPGVWRGGGATGRLRLLTKMIEGRGPDNPRGLASWNPDTEESAYWDVRSTPDVVERSEEVTLRALQEALAWLRAPRSAPFVGGFGTDDMDQWIWGYRHYVHFDSLLADFLSGDEFAGILDQFAIDDDVLPLDPVMTPSDPRYGLPGYPRPGDNFSVDAANPGLDGTTFDYGSGPVFRMVFALGPDGTTTGESILPGGQSGIVGDPHFADQAALWLANDTLPLDLDPDAVAATAIGREVFEPADPLP